MQARQVTTKVREADWAAFQAILTDDGLTPGRTLGKVIALVAVDGTLLRQLADRDRAASTQAAGEWLVPRIVYPIVDDAQWDEFLALAAFYKMTVSAAVAVLVHSVAAGRLVLEVKVRARLPRATSVH